MAKEIMEGLVKTDKGIVKIVGHDGATFVPHISDDYVLSWTNDQGLENPEPVKLPMSKGEIAIGEEEPKEPNVLIWIDTRNVSVKYRDPKTGMFAEVQSGGSADDGSVKKHNESETAHNDIRLLLAGLSGRLNAIADSDDTTLDQLSEIVAYIKANKTLIESVTTSKVNVDDIIDNLTTSVSNKPLSAKMGVELANLVRSAESVASSADAAAYRATENAESALNHARSAMNLASSAEQMASAAQAEIEKLKENGIGGGITEETDPTVPAWAKEPEKPKYTAQEVGAAAKEQFEQISKEIAYETTARENAIADLKVQGVQQTPLFAESVDWLNENGDTSKPYVLPDGYIYAYRLTTTTIEPQYNNILDGTTLHLNERYSISSGGYSSGKTGILATDWLPANTGDVIRMNVPLSAHAKTSCNIFFKSTTGTIVNSSYNTSNSVPVAEENDGMATSFTVGTVYNTYGDPSSGTKVFNNIQYVLINMFISASSITDDDVADLVITKNEEIKESETVTVYQWTNTGRAFVPADYEDRIIDLEEKAANHTTKISAIDERVSVLENKTDESDINADVPDYWKNSVNTAISKVKALQDDGGSDVVNFMWFSDVHYGGSKNYVGNIGVISEAVMESCDIPLALMCGDTLTAGVLDTEDKLMSTLEEAWDIYSPIGADRLMLVSGNHEDVYGQYTAEDGTTVYYVNKADHKKVWNKLYRPQSTDFRRVFDNDGTYFYLDNVPQKIRFVCLNSSFYDGGALTNGTTKAMSFGFGAEQLDWFENTALAVKDDWSVVVCVHVPPIASYEGLFTGNNYTEIRRIITDSTADIIAVFTGHMHRDNVVTGDLPCPIITVICAINTPYDGTEAERVAGTDKETALDVVSINKATKTINCTRIGAGSDREIKY